MNTFDPLNTVRDSFLYNLSTYGTLITIGDKQVKALFKLEQANDREKQNQYLTMFTDYAEAIPQGQEFVLQGKHYITLKDNSDENTIYNKAKCVSCNQLIKYELKHSDDKTKADLTHFYCYADNLSAVNSTNGGLITIQSTCHFMFPLTDHTKRIRMNDRFFVAQAESGVWKVRDLNYQNGIVDVYCVRDPVDTSVDDTEKLIADRWLYEHKPDDYVITLSPDVISIMEGHTQDITVSVTKNGEPMKTPKVSYIVSDPTVASVDPNTNTLTGLKHGTATITANYRPFNNDHCNSTAIKLEVTEIPADVFKITFATTELPLSEGDEQQLEFTLTKNGEPYEPLHELEYTVVPDGIISISSSGLVSTVATGDCTITASYKDKENDLCTSNSIAVTVAEKVAQSISVTPEYNDTTWHTVRQKEDILFTCVAEGIASPKWDITLDPMGVPASSYENTIDNNAGTFHIKCVSFRDGNRMQYIIKELTSGLTIDYQIKLVSMFG